MRGKIIVITILCIIGFVWFYLRWNKAKDEIKLFTSCTHEIIDHVPRVSIISNASNFSITEQTDKTIVDVRIATLNKTSNKIIKGVAGCIFDSESKILVNTYFVKDAPN